MKTLTHEDFRTATVLASSGIGVKMIAKFLGVSTKVVIRSLSMEA